ncbi:MAG TPA: 50S ribosomal protein L17 [Elusimicrobia bacterium]|jgi:large subunit ribosomal protein L17|nr:50S ribosomal protein L17 [Elusimicrobiota bacterium]
MAKYRPYRKLGRTQTHREATLRNLALALFQHEKIKTSEAKAKELRRYSEKIISWAKKNDLTARRAIARKIKNPTISKKIFEVLVPRYQNHPGGYTQIFKIGSRDSDGASLCLIKLVS